MCGLLKRLEAAAGPREEEVQEGEVEEAQEEVKSNRGCFSFRKKSLRNRQRCGTLQG